ncbi:MAG TPA: GAF domain-containing sensor histidine kinase, partial [Candidatus Eisenbacteria bacterium]|nr:GAF domain-containing sensor histidine kinase [Candidatus Eisenbacteria bacterium]
LHQPAHRGARRLLAMGVTLSVAFGVGALYSAYVELRGAPAWAGAAVLVVLALNWATSATTLALFAVFPDGRYHRSYERGLVTAAVLAVPVLAALEVVGQATLSANTPFVWQDSMTGHNRFAVAGLAPVGAVAAGVLQAGPVLLVTGAVLLVLRHRRAGPEQRRQIAWPLYALVLTVVCTAVLGAMSPTVNRLPMWLGYLVYYPVLLLVPVSLLIGMRRHRLLDIDLVVRRSAVYGVLWLLIAALYVGVAAVLGVVVGRRVPLDLAVLVTILATIVAAPARRRLERLADRLVFGHRLSGYELIGALGARLESSPAAEDVAGTVAAGVRAGLGARWVRVVLARPVPTPVAAAGIELTAPAEPVLSVPLVHGQEAVGTIECGAKADGRYSDADQQLLQTLGRQAALAIRNSQLSAELAGRLEELAASRVRLVHAEEAGRRRLERDIHDGVQQELVAVLARLGMARNQLRRDGGLAEETLRQVQADTRRALESLQELVRGIHPPILTDRGLLEAVEERAARLPIPARVDSPGLGRGVRLAGDVEGAAYFFVSEALANVLKHARARQTWVCLRLGDGSLTVQVRDDGRGFDVPATLTSGLRGLADRIEALDGRVEVESTPGAGTTVRAFLPAKERVDA